LGSRGGIASPIVTRLQSTNQVEKFSGGARGHVGSCWMSRP
jgi:hypothetical protein